MKIRCGSAQWWGGLWNFLDARLAASVEHHLLIEGVRLSPCVTLWIFMTAPNPGVSTACKTAVPACHPCPWRWHVWTAAAPNKMLLCTAERGSSASLFWSWMLAQRRVRESHRALGLGRGRGSCALRDPCWITPRRSAGIIISHVLPSL